MGETEPDPVDLKAETVIKLLDLIVHKTTSPEIRENALLAYRRLSKGFAPSVIFGDNSEIFLIEEEYAERYARQEIDLNKYKIEIRRLTSALNAARRRQNQTNPAVSHPEKIEVIVDQVVESLDLSITDAEWAAIHDIIPQRYRCDYGRERIATLIVVLGIGRSIKHPWRVLRTADKPDGWTTFYNQLRSWQQKEWWGKVIETLGSAA